MSDNDVWVDAVRRSHDRFVASVSALPDVTAPSYASEWTIADVASHLGSQAEIFSLFLNAGLSGQTPPGPEAFGPIWDEWNAKSPQQQVADSVAVNEAFVSRLEALSDDERSSLSLAMFGMELNLAGLLAMRLGEHALHTWDIEVAVDPSAVVAPDAVELLIDRVGMTAGRAGKPIEVGRSVAVSTVEPERRLSLITGPEVSLTTDDAPIDAVALQIPAEAFVRLVYGRLDADHTPEDVDPVLLEELRAVFPGF